MAYHPLDRMYRSWKRKSNGNSAVAWVLRVDETETKDGRRESHSAAEGERISHRLTGLGRSHRKYDSSRFRPPSWSFAGRQAGSTGRVILPVFLDLGGEIEVVPRVPLLGSAVTRSWLAWRDPHLGTRARTTAVFFIGAGCCRPACRISILFHGAQSLARRGSRLLGWWPGRLAGRLGCLAFFFLILLFFSLSCPFFSFFPPFLSFSPYWLLPVLPSFCRVVSSFVLPLGPSCPGFTPSARFVLLTRCLCPYSSLSFFLSIPSWVLLFRSVVLPLHPQFHLSLFSPSDTPSSSYVSFPSI